MGCWKYNLECPKSQKFPGAASLDTHWVAYSTPRAPAACQRTRPLRDLESHFVSHYDCPKKNWLATPLHENEIFRPNF